MQIIALRSEYQLSVHHVKNRIFYQNFEQMQGATALPHYLADWAAALAAVQPGFTILSDMQVVNRANPGLRAEFLGVEQLIVRHGVRVVAEIHVPGLSTRYFHDVVTTSLAMPVRHFLDIWEATHFLDGLQPLPSAGASSLLPGFVA